MITKWIDFINEGESDSVKEDRKKILEYLGLKDWSIFLRKLQRPFFSNFRYKFEFYLRNFKVSPEFIDKYKDLKVFPSFIDIILKNKEYSVDELLGIIEKYPDYIDWYYVFYNERIPIDFKKKNYDKIYRDSLVSFDNSVPMNIRIRNTKKALSILEDYSPPMGTPLRRYFHKNSLRHENIIGKKVVTSDGDVFYISNIDPIHDSTKLPYQIFCSSRPDSEFGHYVNTDELYVPDDIDFKEAQSGVQTQI